MEVIGFLVVDGDFMLNGPGVGMFPVLIMLKVKKYFPYRYRGVAETRYKK